MHFLQKFKTSKSDPTAGRASRQSGSPGSSRRSLRERFGWGSRTRSLSRAVEMRNITSDRSTTSQPQTTASVHGQPDVPSYSPPPLVATGSPYASVSAPIIQVLPPQSEPTASEGPSPASIHTSSTPAPTNHVQGPAKTAGVPQTRSTPVPDIDTVWAEALQIANEKLGNNNLSLTNLTSQLPGGDIRAVIEALDTLRAAEKDKRWHWTWNGKRDIIVESLGKILKIAEPYSGIVDTSIQSKPGPGVAALAWAGLWAIIRVTLNHVEMIEGFETAIAVLIEKLTICEFYAGIFAGAQLPAGPPEHKSMLSSALPGFYAAVIVFVVKAHSYFEAGAVGGFASTSKSFNIEFQPLIEEMNTKEEVVSKCASLATMDRIREIKGALQSITLQLNDISTIATETLNVSVEIRNYVKDDRVFELLKTLTPLEPLKRHHNVKLPRAKNTGTWLLRLESFCEWWDSNSVEKDSYVFCCYGTPGAGKTMICSLVVDYLHSQSKHSDTAVACLYADYKDQNNQTLVHILGSFLHQLLTTAQQPIPDEVVQKLHDIQVQGKKVETEDILALLKIRLQQFKRAFICIDAVDELEPRVLQQLLIVLKDIVTNDTRLFLTGRGHIESEIQKHLQVSQRYKTIISASQRDIQEFVEQQITHDLNSDAMDEVLAKDIADAITEKSQGMFLLPALHIKMVLEMPTIAERREALGLLPTDLHDAFRGVISRIKRRPSASAELGMQVLMWLHFSHRLLKVEELQHALAVKKDHKEFNAGYIPSQKVLLDCCLGLVLVDEETSTVRFTHFTLEEFFHDNARTEFPDECSYIAETCLTYLNFEGLRQHCMDLDILKGNLTKYPFLNYAALYWGTYYVKQQSTDSLTKLARPILEHESERPPCAIQALYSLKLDQRCLKTAAQKFSGVHATAYFGLHEMVGLFFKVELKDESDRTPLSWAAEKGHEAVVRLLIERDDVDVRAKDNGGCTPLLWAAIHGHKAVVQLLIEKDRDYINARDKWGMTPLIWAADGGHGAVVCLLRDGIGINAKDSVGKTPLIRAVENGHEAVVRLLVERYDVNIDINAKDNRGMTALIWAALRGHEALVRLLIERDSVDVNARDNEGKTPLRWAAKMGKEAVVRMLIERVGVDINARDNDGKTPFISAAEWGQEAVVRLLVDRDDVDIDAKDEEGKTPFIWAAQRGKEAVVRLLVEKEGVDINAQDNEGKTALSWAVFGRQGPTVQLLIERAGIDINVKDNVGKTPLTWAVEIGYEDVVRLMICRDGDIGATDNEGKTLLIWAARTGNVPLVRLLIERDGVDIDAKDNTGKTPLIWAAEYGYEAVIWQLVEKGGVDINARDNDGKTPLIWAAENGRSTVVRLLLKKEGVDIGAKDNEGRTALSSAVVKVETASWWDHIRGHKVVVHLLSELVH